MYRKFLFFAVICILGYGQCKKSCDNTDIFLSAGDFRWKHLDEKSNPVKELQPGEESWKDGYGFRLYASSALTNPADTAGVKCPLYSLSPRIQSVAVRSLTGMGDLFPAGSDVTPLFRFVNGSGTGEISAAGAYLSNILATQGTSFCDFVLANALQDAGWQQLEIKVNMDDATSLTMLTDSVYLK